MWCAPTVTSCEATQEDNFVNHENREHPGDQMSANELDGAVNETVPTDEDFEVERIKGIRAFEVTKANGVTEIVLAHYHDTGAGLLYFITTNRDGKKVINRAFSKTGWLDVREITESGNHEGSKRVN
jgi:hypothetical protein